MEAEEAGSTIHMIVGCKDTALTAVESNVHATIHPCNCMHLASTNYKVLIIMSMIAIVQSSININSVWATKAFRVCEFSMVSRQRLENGYNRPLNKGLSRRWYGCASKCAFLEQL